MINTIKQFEELHIIDRETVVELLQLQLPQSLPLFRRVQSPPRSPHTVVVATFAQNQGPKIPANFKNEGGFDVLTETDAPNCKLENLICQGTEFQSIPPDEPFMVAEIDIDLDTFGTNVWIYSSYERSASSADSDSTASITQNEILTAHFKGLFNFIRALNKNNGYGISSDKPVIFGAVHQSFIEIMKKTDNITRVSPAYYKQVFITSEKDLADVKKNKGYDRYYAKSADNASIETIVGTSKIPRDKSLLLQRLNICLHDRINNEAAAWCFLSLDGSLITLYVREKYREQGLAKRVFIQLVNTKMFDVYGKKGSDSVIETTPQWKWVHADVETDNKESNGVCKSLGCKISWLTHWLEADLSF
ncbi:hypothetical protein NADFUDRAFT_49249 [Nadsonia fulvescens var. elongata DSM 6958]|uniref:FR47-like domain-containing protein n=1 Tax=Nadsonia fulvescens var. elongata DSM 6958 TaxID=857566 RepID=A0A1E3PTF2_9ASCO|nr:hypothetical protein NADFUDRAFT_49249 [Nadsonia fulvescens var. elongata DSM 6958]